MTEEALRMQTGKVIRLCDHRARPPAPAAWQNDIEYCGLYADKLRTAHDAEQAEIRLALKERGIRFWWEGPQDIRDRVDANNVQWQIYRALLKHLAALPAQTRREASIKRATIGKQWLVADSEYYADLRSGCEADDHLFPKSLKLAKEARRAN